MTDVLAAQRLALVRAVHTATYVVMSVSVFAVLFAGLTGARGAWVCIALVLVCAESAVFIGNGLKCPLTALAVKYGARDGPLFDTFLPERFTRYTFMIFAPLIMIGLGLLAARWFGLLN